MQGGVFLYDIQSKMIIFKNNHVDKIFVKINKIQDLQSLYSTKSLDFYNNKDLLNKYSDIFDVYEINSDNQRSSK